MKRTLLTLAVAAAVAVPAAAFACDGMEQAAHQPKKVTVTELASWTKAKQATPVDANGEKTRTEQGIIPGAVLLTSSSMYEAKELPQARDSKLVFYCANERCSASKKAAVKAMEAGYTDVSILPVGIKGWKDAGQATAKPNS